MCLLGSFFTLVLEFSRKIARSWWGWVSLDLPWLVISVQHASVLGSPRLFVMIANMVYNSNRFYFGSGTKLRVKPSKL